MALFGISNVEGARFLRRKLAVLYTGGWEQKFQSSLVDLFELLTTRYDAFLVSVGDKGI